MEIMVAAAYLALAVLCLITAFAALLLAMDAKIEVRAMQESTHQIEWKVPTASEVDDLARENDLVNKQFDLLEDQAIEEFDDLAGFDERTTTEPRPI